MPQVDDNAFLRLVAFPDLKRRYEKELKLEIRQIEEEFKRSYDNRRAMHDREIETYRRHDEVVSMCIHPFSEEGTSVRQLGYQFIRAEPLSELGIKNVDFLIYRREGRTPIVIFGEAKSRITNFSQTLREVGERRANIETRTDYVKTNYLKTTSDPIFEYVLAVPTSIAIETRDAIWRTKEKFSG